MADHVEVKFKADGKGFQSEVKQMDESVRGFADKVGSVKTAIAGLFIVEAAHKFYDAIKAIDDKFGEFVHNIQTAHRQTEANTVDLQVWSKQMGKVGGDIDTVVKFINKLAVAREKAFEEPNGKEAKAFERLGVSLDKLATLGSGAGTFKYLQEQISATGTVIGKTAELTDLLGEKAVKNLAVFADSFSATEAKLRAHGKLIEEEIIARYEKLRKFNTENTILGAVTGGESQAGISTLFQYWQAIQKIGVSGVVGSAYAALTGNKGANPFIQNASNQSKELVQAVTESTPEALQNKAGEERLQQLLADKLALRASREEQAAKEAEKLAKEEEKASEEFNKIMDEWAEEQTRKQKSWDDYIADVNKKMFASYISNDALVSTGNFLGTARSRIESVATSQLERLESIDETLKAMLQQGGSTDKSSFPDL